MITNFSSYKVKVKEIPFLVRATGKQYTHTASISFYDNNRKEIAYKELGYIDTESIYQMIDNHESINIDYCYIEDFSINAYRNSRNISPEVYIKINGFSAQYCIFDSNICTDFSFIDFGDNDVLFQNTCFINGSTTFRSIKAGQSNINFSYVFFNNGNVDFSNSIFKAGNFNIKNAVFRLGDKNFQDVQFGIGEKNFTNTEFGNGDVSFINTNFNDGKFLFKIARIGLGKVDFHFSKFGNGEKNFERAEFGNGKADFKNVEFNEGKVNFNRSVFGDGEINFEGCSLKNSRITFLRTIFASGDLNFEALEFNNSDIVFEKVEFSGGNVSFNNSQCNSLTFTSCQLNSFFDIRLAYCNTLNLSDTIIRDIVDMMPYDFEVKINTLILSNVRLLGRIECDWNKNKILQSIENQTSSYKDKAEQFRILKQNYNTTGQYNYEDLAYIYFKRYEQKAELHEALNKNKISAIWQYPVYGFKWLMFDKVGLYATSPGRVLVSVVFSWLIVTFFHIILPLISSQSAVTCIPNEASIFERIFTTMYYSAITFFTIGYGECCPLGLNRFIAGIEGFIGVFMMSYFTVAFARKILR